MVLERTRKAITWYYPWQRGFDAGYEEVDFSWFSGGRLTASLNRIDRHLSAVGDTTAIILVLEKQDVYRCTS